MPIYLRELDFYFPVVFSASYITTFNSNNLRKVKNEKQNGLALKNVKEIVT